MPRNQVAKYIEVQGRFAKHLVALRSREALGAEPGSCWTDAGPDRRMIEEEKTCPILSMFTWANVSAIAGGLRA
tara:strand:- start:3029 stop:3250 length:222 start_codon:yes stop_codon:yes gene_type:complete